MFRYSFLSIVALCLSVNMLWAEERGPLPDYVIAEFGSPPSIPEGALSPAALEAVEEVLAIAVNQGDWGSEKTSALDVLAQAKDPRLVWLITDMQRFVWQAEFHSALTELAKKILNKSFETGHQRSAIIDTMMAWDVPAYPGYIEHKRTVFTNYIPGWEEIFVEGDIAWQLVDWGGVNIDDRPYDTTDEICHCIPATDNPEVSSAEEATWLKDEDIVFGIVINGEARAYPRRIMEVREMVNDTLGGRDLAIPYCTLCGAAQAYFTDDLPSGVNRPVLRTSGLLIRSNKVMYDIETHSVFDTFLGKAITGPLSEVGLQLKQTTVITADWGSWRKAHPDTTVLVEALALGRDFNLRETRDANGPIFPVGDVDPRLPVQEDIVGVVAADGTPIAFSRAAAVVALTAGKEVAFKDVKLELSAGGLRATSVKGDDLSSHQAFWFAWSQFYPKTALWKG